MKAEDISAVKTELISARQRIEQGNYRAACLHMKWAIEQLLPESQQYCSQTLPDDDPDKTIQGYLDNIVHAAREDEKSHFYHSLSPIPKSDTPVFDAIYGDLTACRDCGKPIPVTANQCVHCSHDN